MQVTLSSPSMRSGVTHGPRTHLLTDLQCVSLGSPWWHQISSWGPDGGQKVRPTKSGISTLLGTKKLASSATDTGVCFAFRRDSLLILHSGGYCKWWSPDGCDADSCWRYGGNPSIGPVRAPGISNTGQWQDGNFNWNDQVGSWICYNE